MSCIHWFSQGPHSNPKYTTTDCAYKLSETFWWLRFGDCNSSWRHFSDPIKLSFSKISELSSGLIWFRRCKYFPESSFLSLVETYSTWNRVCSTRAYFAFRTAFYNFGGWNLRLVRCWVYVISAFEWCWIFFSFVCSFSRSHKFTKTSMAGLPRATLPDHIVNEVAQSISTIVLCDVSRHLQQRLVPTGCVMYLRGEVVFR